MRYRYPSKLAAVIRLLEEMAAADVCDAVHILTPPHIHASLAQDCLKAGFHVMVEKPIAMNAQEGDAMCRAAKKAGKKVVVVLFGGCAIRAESALSAGVSLQGHHSRAPEGSERLETNGQPPSWMSH